MKSKNILLLGGGGFLGRALAKRLADTGLAVQILEQHPVVMAGQNITAYQGNLDNEALLHELLPRCGAVVHLASATTPGSSAHQPLLELELNIAPSLRFLSVLQQYDGIHLIYLSSGGVIYGNPRHLPVGEDHPLAPLSFHGAGKAAIEAFLQVYGSRPEGHVTILRPSNLYGPGQPLRQGFGIIRTMLEHLRAGTTMEIWGDGEVVRDFIYVDDIVEVCVKFINLPTDRGVYNVGTGVGYSINQLKEAIERLCGGGISVVYRGQRGIDVKTVVLDCSRLQARLGWRPQISLEEGIRRTWKWLKTQ